uniref:Ig-like domain-containing protein n=1 Tax=Spermophilus dauricus TaxID=99837 RepID=A0A8C9PR40_SPEDA
MKCPPDTRSGHSPAWKKLLLIGEARGTKSSVHCGLSGRHPRPAARGSFAGGWMSTASAEGRSAASLSGLHPVALLPVPTDSPRQVQLRTSPSAVRGVIYSDLNFSVIMAWTVTMDPEPELTWTLNGRLCGTGEELFIRRLSRELLGTYVCTGRNSQQLLSSYPVTVSLPPEPREDLYFYTFFTGVFSGVNGELHSPKLFD